MESSFSTSFVILIKVLVYMSGKVHDCLSHSHCYIVGISLFCFDTLSLKINFGLKENEFKLKTLVEK